MSLGPIIVACNETYHPQLDLQNIFLLCSPTLCSQSKMFLLGHLLPSIVIGCLVLKPVFVYKFCSVEATTVLFTTIIPVCLGWGLSHRIYVFVKQVNEWMSWIIIFPTFNPPNLGLLLGSLLLTCLRYFSVFPQCGPDLCCTWKMTPIVGEDLVISVNTYHRVWYLEIA